jgi:hypothetical protein
VSTDGTTTRVDVMAGADCVASWPLGALARDLTLVDALAHLGLFARHRGWSIRVCDCDDDLRSLLELVGLTGVLSLESRR